MIVNESKGFFGFETEEELRAWAASELRDEAGVTIDDLADMTWEMWGAPGGGGCCEGCYAEYVKFSVEYEGTVLTYTGTYGFSRTGRFCLMDKRLDKDDEG